MNHYFFVCLIGVQRRLHVWRLCSGGGEDRFGAGWCVGFAAGMFLLGEKNLLGLLFWGEKNHVCGCVLFWRGEEGGGDWEEGQSEAAVVARFFELHVHTRVYMPKKPMPSPFSL